MSSVRPSLLWLVLGTAFLAACQVTMSSDDDGTGGAGGTAGSGGTSGTGGTGGAAGTGGTSGAGGTAGTGGTGGTAGTGGTGGDPMTYFRLATLSPDSPAFDFCIAVHDSTAWGGPLIADIAEQVGSDGSSGLGFGQVSIYMAVPVDTYDLRVVAAGSSDCSTALIDDIDLPAMAEDEWRTLALVGDKSVVGSDPSLSVKVFQDHSAGVADYVKLRFLHASPGLGTLDFGLGSLTSDTYNELFSSVSFGSLGQTSAYGTVDSFGYLKLTPFSGQVFSVHAAGGTTDKIITSGATLAGEHLGTFFVIGGKTDDTTTPAHILYCDDDTSAGGYLTACHVISST